MSRNFFVLNNYPILKNYFYSIHSLKSILLLFKVCLCTKISSLLCNHPYEHPFITCSSYKSSAVATLHDIAKHLSGQQPEHSYKHLILHSHIGKKFFADMRNSENFSKLLKNINIMHSNAPSKHKSNILSLLAKIFSRKELHNAGFLFSNTQYSTAQYKAQKQDFSLNDYICHFPFSHTKTSSETINLIIQSLLHYSRNSTYRLINTQTIFPILLLIFLIIVLLKKYITWKNPKILLALN